MTTQHDDCFGLCPVCHKTDGYVNAGKTHRFYCREHRTSWCAGSNLFSTWRSQTEAEQRKIWYEIGLGDFQDVEPYFHPSTLDEAAGLKPADGERAHILRKLQNEAFAAIKIIELECSGVRDGDGCWHGDVIGGMTSDLINLCNRLMESYQSSAPPSDICVPFDDTNPF